jgi:hypothetical protein
MISHSPEGRPVFPGMGLSISHAAGMAVAVALVGTKADPPPQAPQIVAKQASTGWINWMALLLAAAALLLALKH